MSLLTALILVFITVQSTNFSIAQITDEQITNSSDKSLINATLLGADNSITVPTINATELLFGNLTELSKPEIKLGSSYVKEKIYLGFDKKITNMINSGEDRNYNVIIYVSKVDESGLDVKTLLEKNKEKLANDIIRIHNAKNVYKAQVMSFVSASVPLTEIQKLTNYKHVFLIGDGEGKITLLSDIAKDVINTNDSFGVNGSKIKIAVVDSGIRQSPEHTDLKIGQKIIEQTFCSSTGCTLGNFSDNDGHGTHVAGIIAGLGSVNDSMKGVASGSSILNAKLNFSDPNGPTMIGKALDWSLMKGAHVINLSIGIGQCSNQITNLMVDEAVDKGVVVVIAAGNEADANGDGIEEYHTITNPACSFNPLVVGNMDDMNSLNSALHEIRLSSSRGPTNVTLNEVGRIKPELVAPGTLINSTAVCDTYNDRNRYNSTLGICQATEVHRITGTSFAAPFVSGAAALVLESHPEYSPLMVKSTLLLGAKWNPKNDLNVPQTASQYESGGSSNLTLNSWGFGLLDVGQSLTYANTGNNIIQDVISQGEIKQYTIDVLCYHNVKVILSWLKHPLANVTSPYSVTQSNLDLKITHPNGFTRTSNSTNQNNEFIVYKQPCVHETLTVTVSAPSVSSATGSAEVFTLATTHQINEKSLFANMGTFTKTTSTGSQAVTGIGFKPKALVLFSTGQTSDGFTDTYNVAVGFSNGSSSRSVSARSDDNTSSSNAGRAFGTQVITTLGSGTPTIGAQADLVSFDPDGFTLNWTVNDSNSSLIRYLALGGQAITNASVSSFVANTVTGNQAVSVGFKPDFVMFMHAASTSETSTATHGYLSYGLATFSDRGALAVASEDGRSSMDTWRYQRVDRALLALTESSGSIDAEADIVSMNPDGFTINWLNAPASADRIYYLALKGGQYKVGNFLKSQSTPNIPQSITTNFKPSGLIFSSVNNDALASVQSNNRLSLGAYGGATSSFIWAGDRDSVADSITARHSAAIGVIMLATEQPVGSSSTWNSKASIYSVDNLGFKLDWSPIESSFTEILYVAFGGMPGSNIIIVEDTIPDSAKNFNYTSGDFTSFSLDDDTDPTLTDTKIFANLVPGTYSISQTPDEDYTTTSSCSDGSPVTAISLGLDETLTCRFVNAKKATLVIVEDTIPNSSTDFQFVSGNFTSFYLDDDFDPTLSNTITFSDLDPGTYNISETPNSLYTTTSSCSDGSTISTMTLDAGETVTCTFKNESVGIWQYREHKSFAPWTPDWSFSKESTDPKRATFSTGTTDLGTAYLFKVFNKADIAGRTIKITWQGQQTAGSGDGAGFLVLDGAYDRTSSTDFPNSASRLSKGNGTLGSLSHNDNWGSVTDTLTPNWGYSTSDKVTIFVDHYDVHFEGATKLYIEKIEIVDFATYVFYDPILTQEVAGTVGDYGTYTSTPSIAPSNVIVIKNVVNDNGRTLTPSNFTMYVNALNANPSSSQGTTSGTVVSISSGSYNIGEEIIYGKTPGYIPSYSSDCSGSISIGQNKTCTVTNNDSFLGGVWEFREHDVFSGWDTSNAFLGGSGSRIEIGSGLPTMGNAYLFRTFDKADIVGRDIKVTWQGTQWVGCCEGTSLEIVDGVYDRASFVDFPPEANRISKGNGTLGNIGRTGSWGNTTETLTPNWSFSASDKVTIFINHNDVHVEGAHTVYVQRIEIVGYATYEFANTTKSQEISDTQFDQGYFN